MIDSIFLRERLVLDTGCITNLYATGYLQSLLEFMPIPVVIANPVYRATHHVYNGPDDNIRQAREEVDLRFFVEKKLLLQCLPDCNIEDVAANLAGTNLIDDEDVVTYAIALYYSWSLGTDDLQFTRPLQGKHQAFSSSLHWTLSNTGLMLLALHCLLSKLY